MLKLVRIIIQKYVPHMFPNSLEFFNDEVTFPNVISSSLKPIRGSTNRNIANV